MSGHARRAANTIALATLLGLSSLSTASIAAKKPPTASLTVKKPFASSTAAKKPSAASTAAKKPSAASTVAKKKRSAASLAQGKRVPRAVTAARLMPVASVPLLVPEVELTPAQLAAASQVLAGPIACELGQTVQISPIDGKPGHFMLTFENLSYAVVPQVTTTGAVRLEDSKSEVVWLQIPAKSMMLNTRLGQRVADNCMHELQRSVVTDVGNSLGIADAPASAPTFLSLLHWPLAVGHACVDCSVWTVCQSGAFVDLNGAPGTVCDGSSLAWVAGLDFTPRSGGTAPAAEEADPEPALAPVASEPTGRLDGM